MDGMPGMTSGWNRGMNGMNGLRGMNGMHMTPDELEKNGFHPDMMVSTKTFLTWSMSSMGMLGLFMVGASAGLWQYPEKHLPAMEAMTNWWVDHVYQVLGIKMWPNFLRGTIGLGKVFGILALHGLFGKPLELLANIGFCVLFLLIIPTHLHVRAAMDPYALAPLGFLIMATARLLSRKG